VLRPFSFGIKGCLASLLPLAEEEVEGRDERDLIDARVEWNSLVRSFGAILCACSLDQAAGECVWLIVRCIRSII